MMKTNSSIYLLFVGMACLGLGCVLFSLVLEKYEKKDAKTEINMVEDHINELERRIDAQQEEIKFLKEAATTTDSQYSDGPIPVSQWLQYRDIEIEREFVVIGRKIGLTPEDYKNIE